MKEFAIRSVLRRDAPIASSSALDLFLAPQLSFPLRASRLVVYVSVTVVMLGVGLVSAFAPRLRASRSEVATLLRESAG